MRSLLFFMFSLVFTNTRKFYLFFKRLTLFLDHIETMICVHIACYSQNLAKIKLQYWLLIILHIGHY